MYNDEWIRERFSWKELQTEDVIKDHIDEKTFNRVAGPKE
jgi:hypothetical protein